MHVWKNLRDSIQLDYLLYSNKKSIVTLTICTLNVHGNIYKILKCKSIFLLDAFLLYLFTLYHNVHRCFVNVHLVYLLCATHWLNLDAFSLSFFTLVY